MIVILNLTAIAFCQSTTKITLCPDQSGEFIKVFIRNISDKPLDICKPCVETLQISCKLLKKWVGKPKSSLIYEMPELFGKSYRVILPPGELLEEWVPTEVDNMQPGYYSCHVSYNDLDISERAKSSIGFTDFVGKSAPRIFGLKVFTKGRYRFETNRGK